MIGILSGYVLRGMNQVRLMVYLQETIIYQLQQFKIKLLFLVPFNPCACIDVCVRVCSVRR